MRGSAGHLHLASNTDIEPSTRRLPPQIDRNAPEVQARIAACAAAMRAYFVRHGLEESQVTDSEDGPNDVRDSFWRERGLADDLMGYVVGDEPEVAAAEEVA